MLEYLCLVPNWNAPLTNALTECGIGLLEVHHETGIHILDLKDMQKNNGNRYFRHKVVAKVERFFRDDYGFDVEKRKKD